MTEHVAKLVRGGRVVAQPASEKEMVYRRLDHVEDELGHARQRIISLRHQLQEQQHTRKGTLQAERDHWIRLFNRLEGAVSRHIEAKTNDFADDADEALQAAHSRVLKAATSPGLEGDGE